MKKVTLLLPDTMVKQYQKSYFSYEQQRQTTHVSEDHIPVNEQNLRLALILPGGEGDCYYIPDSDNVGVLSIEDIGEETR